MANSENSKLCEKRLVDVNEIFYAHTENKVLEEFQQH
jgi:hypothetical protein